MAKNHQLRHTGIVIFLSLLIAVFTGQKQFLFAQTNEVETDHDQFIIQQKSEKRTDFFNSVQNQLQSSQSDYSRLTHHIREAEKKLDDVKSEKLSLQSQLDALNLHIVNSIVLVRNVSSQITEKENELQRLTQAIEEKDAEISHQKQMLLEYLEVLYKQENDIISTNGQRSEVNIIKLLFSDKSPADALREMKYFHILEGTGHAVFEKLERLVERQKARQIELENNRNKLVMLYRQLDEEKENLKVQSAAKAHLLDATKGQERIYEQLVEESRQEQSQVSEDISALRYNLEFIRAKIIELGDKFDPKNYTNLLGRETTSVYKFIKDTKDQTELVLRWPVSPARGISAYFHDDAYRRSMGIAHNAIDIRVPHGTPIRAPADAVVYKAKDNGFGYSYIVLAHAGGFMTVYGHVPEIRVIEGEKISEGQVIGLSGATPGTKGAGLLTTGPHLHFEILKGGQYVDPLDHLPLGVLPLETLPTKYLNKITGDPFKVRRAVPEESAGDDRWDLLKLIESSGDAERDTQQGLRQLNAASQYSH